MQTIIKFFISVKNNLSSKIKFETSTHLSNSKQNKGVRNLPRLERTPPF